MPRVRLRHFTYPPLVLAPTPVRTPTESPSRLGRHPRHHRAEFSLGRRRRLEDPATSGPKNGPPAIFAVTTGTGTLVWSAGGWGGGSGEHGFLPSLGWLPRESAYDYALLRMFDGGSARRSN